MHCPFCQAEDTKVIDSRLVADGSQTRRSDFSASPAAMALYEKNFAVVATPCFSKPDPLLPADYEKHLIKNDFAWASANRDRILAEWTKRYDGKSEKK